MGADAYPDSSFLVSMHRQDNNHAAACSLVAKAAISLTYTPLHRIEVRNALRNATAAGQMTSMECRTAFQQIEEDIRDNFLIHTPIDWTDVFRRADDLSDKHAARNGQRTIDLLHVAAALESGARTFLTFDARQKKLARAAGLKVKP
ncbi:MAG TPA: type II toxin-antitoxin system VapC family toxin [Chthoniobacteraceae bacterium]|nr:type II toxin-antitoxin system VapC family toxin [Chthoniobacteraceae bacterium]